MSIYDFSRMEKKWTEEWRKKRVYEPNLDSPRGKKFYNLMMFPYPSAEGLHVGNMYAFTGTDIYGRFKRMQGHDVFQPIGLDGFGIHSENYAIKTGTHPAVQARVSEERFYKQLEIVGNGFAWNEKLETYDPEYYKWTQWIFTEMWRQGLAYRKKQPVNWCPSCKTVLSDEQAEGGKCERCETEVVKKDLEQWFFRITKYADKLLQNLEKIDWSEKVKIAQRNWIGKSEGALLTFPVKDSDFSLEVFTTRPDTLFGATYMVVAPEHEIVENLKEKISNIKEVEDYIALAKKKTDEERIENKEKTGVELKGIKAINPVNNEEIPIFVADYVLSGYGTGAIMAVPAHDERDFEFAEKFGLEIKKVISDGETDSKIKEAYIGDGTIINSGKFDGMDIETAKKEITKFAGGKMHTQFRLRDWLISRQRYWGPPIPMIFCETCAKKNEGEQSEMPGWYAVPENELPVVLPDEKELKEFRPEGTGVSPLASLKSFQEIKCPKCGGEARRETDVSDTFLDSAWYYVGYLAKKGEHPFKSSRRETWLPVDMYIGGAEHSVLHLLYVRFIAMAMKDAGYLSFEEPFPKFRAHGLLIKEGAKMSKSKGNVVNPDEYIKKYGADAFRMYLMFLAPFEQGGDFRDQGILGVVRFLEKTWRFFEREEEGEPDANLERKLHQTVKKVSEDMENLRYNTAISALMILLGEFEKSDSVPEDYKKTFLKLLAPFAPFLTEEIWNRLGGKESIHVSGWPKWDGKKIIEDSYNLVIQINGKVRAQIEMKIGTEEKEAVALAVEDSRVEAYMEGKKPKKIIFVKDKILSIVI